MARDPAIECSHYVPIAGTRRCQSYLDGGGCKREDTFMCTEYLRKSPQAEAGTSSATPAARARVPSSGPSGAATRDLFGEVISVRAQARKVSLPVRPALAAAAMTLQRPIAEEQIKKLEERGVELCVRTEAAGELWLVPKYTGSERNEMTFRDAATIAAVCAVFPGAEVTRFHRDRPRGSQP